MQKHLAIGRGVKILDQKNRGGGGFNEPLPPASLRVKMVNTKGTANKRTVISWQYICLRRKIHCSLSDFTKNR